MIFLCVVCWLLGTFMIFTSDNKTDQRLGLLMALLAAVGVWMAAA